MPTFDPSKVASLRELGFQLADETKEQREPTTDECMAGGCPVCPATRNEPCIGLQIVSTTNQLYIHSERRAMAKHKINVLSNVDKALIVQYAFLILANTIAVHSIKLFGKQLEEKEVQSFFADKAIKELQALGALR